MRLAWALFCSCAVTAGSLVLVWSNGRSIQRYLRSDDEGLPFSGPLDNKEMCSGPRRSDPKNRDRQPYYAKAKYAWNVGNQKEWGNTNNKIIEIFHAIDSALESGGQTVVVFHGWALELLMNFFPDDESWYQFSLDFPVARVSPILSHLLEMNIPTEKFFHRAHPGLEEKQPWDVIHGHRIALLHYMFSSLHGEPCHFLSELQGYLNGKFGTKTYMAVHVRDMEGKCRRFNILNHQECDMEPSFVKGVLEGTGEYGKLPIVILSDMQNTAKLARIKDELYGVVIPQWDMPSNQSVIADLVMGGMSDVFLGNEGSSMSRNAGIIREAFGKDDAMNFIWTKWVDGKWVSVKPHHPYTFFKYSNP